MHPLKAAGENSSLPLFSFWWWWLQILDVPWLIHAPLHYTVLFFLVPLSFPFLYGHHSYWLWAYPNNLILTIISAKTLFPFEASFTDTGGWDSIISLWRAWFNPQHWINNKNVPGCSIPDFCFRRVPAGVGSLILHIRAIISFSGASESWWW